MYILSIQYTLYISNICIVYTRKIVVYSIQTSSGRYLCIVQFVICYVYNIAPTQVEKNAR